MQTYSHSVWIAGNVSCTMSNATCTSDSEESIDEAIDERGGNSDLEEENGRLGCKSAATLKDESTTTLFCGSTLSRLDVVQLLMNVARTHKGSNTCISELLNLLSNVILSSPNSLPASEGIATTMFGGLGLKYNSTDACRNGCILFTHTYAEMIVVRHANHVDIEVQGCPVPCKV